MSLVCLDLKPSYSAQLAVEPYPVGYAFTRSKNLMVIKVIPGSMSYASLWVLLPTMLTIA